MLGGKIRLKFKKITKKQSSKPYDIEKLKDERVSQSFRIELSNRFEELQDSEDLENKWDNFKTTICKAAETTVGYRRGSRREKWISEKTWDLIDKRKTIKAKKDQSRTSHAAQILNDEYRSANKAVKRSCKADKKNWLEGKCHDAEQAASRNDSRTLFRIVRDLTGKDVNQSIPIKSKAGKTLLSEEDQNQRWIEHFSEVLNQPNPDTLFDFNDENDSWVNDSNITLDDISHE